jgi:poly(A) polymerase/tRNA nucleotidyltransferase (CCA-adding enzyme)
MRRAKEDGVRARLAAGMPPFVGSLVDRLAGAGHEVYVVGGAVRDACLERPIQDWDLATDADPDRVTVLFPGTRSFRLKHETVTFTEGGESCEVTPFRRRAGEPRSLEGDLARRDFTLNAMAYDPVRGRLLDRHGGREDIARRRIRAVGCPGDRFKEDPLRLLRAVRFAATLGFRVEPGTLTAVAGCAGSIARVAAERVRNELSALLLAPEPSTGLRLMRQTGLMGQVLPELLEGHLKRQNRYHRYTVLRHTLEAVDRTDPEPLLRWTALLHDVAKPRVRTREGGRWRFLGHAEASADLAAEIMERLRLEGGFVARVSRVIRHHMIGYRPDWSDGAVRRLIRRVGREEVLALIAFRKADILAHGLPGARGGLLEELEGRVRRILEEAPVLGPERLALDGRDIMEITGLPQGPEVGRILSGLVERVVDDPSLNNRTELKRIVEQEGWDGKEMDRGCDRSEHPGSNRGVRRPGR